MCDFRVGSGLGITATSAHKRQQGDQHGKGTGALISHHSPIFFEQRVIVWSSLGCEPPRSVLADHYPVAVVDEQAILTRTVLFYEIPPPE